VQTGIVFVPGAEQVFLFIAGAVAVLLAGAILTRTGRPTGSLDLVDDTLVFLIGDGRVIDANFQGRRVIDRNPCAQSEFDELQLFLSNHFEDAQRLVEPEEPAVDLLVQSRDGQLQAVRQVAGGVIRLRVQFITKGVPSSTDIHTLRAMECELETLRANTSAAPFLLWRQNPDGEIVWANRAYLDTAHRLSCVKDDAWPLPVIFPTLRKSVTPSTRESRRISVSSGQDDGPAWYDCHISPVGHDTLLTAVPADEAVRAENRRREFTQTLTKTFAELAIGLAIFDRSRRLVLFNPALLDLTNLPTDFLTSRPSLVGFLDQLRENRVMPEPRDYRSWRTAISDLEAAAADGTYSETWSLPDGQTYHVSGRPHPDGAVALLFEDISAEMSLTRHFRSELEQFQAVVDAIDDAVAMFSPSGEITILNKAYRALWNIDDDEFLVGDVMQATRRWHELTTPTPVWGDFRDFAQGNADREEWTAKVAMRDGRRLTCRFTPKRGGITLAVFRVEAQDAAQPLRTAV
jgi:PAS domain-containing protein